MGRLLAVALVAVAVAGCQAARLPPSPVPAGWLLRRGDTEDGPQRERVLRAVSILDPVMRRPLEAHVLASDAVNAYAWPSGQIYLTRGLVDLLDDRELVAAIAHEAGHLIGAGHLAGRARPASLAGDRHEEAAADDWGRALLAGAGIPPGAMASMLTAVSHALGRHTKRGRALALRASRIGRIAHRAVRSVDDR